MQCLCFVSFDIRKEALCFSQNFRCFFGEEIGSAVVPLQDRRVFFCCAVLLGSVLPRLVQTHKPGKELEREQQGRLKVLAKSNVKNLLQHAQILLRVIRSPLGKRLEQVEKESDQFLLLIKTQHVCLDLLYLPLLGVLGYAQVGEEVEGENPPVDRLAKNELIIFLVEEGCRAPFVSS